MEYLSEEEKEAVYAHFPGVTQKAIDYATNVVLLDSKYIFVSKDGVMNKGYCTHCHARFFIEGEIKQNGKSTCPHCESECTIKKGWIGHKRLINNAYFLWFDKSPVNPQMVTASWIYCSRDYSESYENVQTKCSYSTLYTFEIGESAMYNVFFWGNGNMEKRKSIHSPQTFSVATEIALCSLVDAVRGTPFQYSGWESYSEFEILKYLELYAEHPNVEILTKNGHRNIVRSRLIGATLHRAIDWKAYKLHDFFKISKQDFQMMKNSKATGRLVMYGPGFAFGLWLWQQARKEKSKLTYEQVIAAGNVFVLDETDRKVRFNKIRKYSTMHRIINYLQKQYEIDSKHYITPSQTLITWSDYIDECLLLDYDLNDEIILYPKD